MDKIEVEARALFAEFAGAWERHDVEAMSHCWVEHGSAIDPWGRFASGRTGVAELLQREHAEAMAASTYRIDHVRVRRLSDTSAVVECDATIAGAQAPNGRPYDLAHTVNAVLTLDGGRWRFLSLHPSFASAGR